MIKYDNSPAFILFISDFESSIPKTELILGFYLKHYFNLDININDFEYSTNGKAYLKAGTLFFSSSNKKNRSAIIISPIDIGLDIEFIDTTKNIQDIAKKTFTVDEYNKVFGENIKNPYEKFFEIWTKKESYLKLIDKPLSQIGNIDINDKNISSFKKDDYIISIAY